MRLAWRVAVPTHPPACLPLARLQPPHTGSLEPKMPVSFLQDDSGQGLVEYALIIAMVAIGLIAILALLRNAIGRVFNTARNTLNTIPGSTF
jgi:pilus assembly protein Flp/PilA